MAGRRCRWRKGLSATTKRRAPVLELAPIVSKEYAAQTAVLAAEVCAAAFVSSEVDEFVFFFEVSGRSLDLVAVSWGFRSFWYRRGGILAVLCVFLMDSCFCRGEISRPFQVFMSPVRHLFLLLLVFVVERKASSFLMFFARARARRPCFHGFFMEGVLIGRDGGRTGLQAALHEQELSCFACFFLEMASLSTARCVNERGGGTPVRTYMDPIMACSRAWRSARGRVFGRHFDRWK
ncbi:unnamed protein product [Ectocarpus sp. 8 AP-2014]